MGEMTMGFSRDFISDETLNRGPIGTIHSKSKKSGFLLGNGTNSVFRTSVNVMHV